MSVAEQVAKRAEQRVLLARRPDEIVELERDLRSRLDSPALAAHGAEQTRSSLTPSDVDSLRTGVWETDDRHITAGRLYMDCVRAVPYRVDRTSRKDRQAIANIAAAYIVEHTAARLDWTERLERQAAARAGSARAGSIGRCVVRYMDLLSAPADVPMCGLPLRREWLLNPNAPDPSDEEPDATGANVARGLGVTPHAWDLLRVAIRHGVRTFKQGTNRTILLRDGESLAELAERENDGMPEVEQGTPFGALADARADELQAVLGLPITAARAIEHWALVQRYIGSIPADASEQDRTAGVKLAASLALDLITAREQVTRSYLSMAISRGHTVLRDRYPEPRELRAALEDACAALRAMASDRLALALAAYADGEATEAEAREALAEYRSKHAGLSPSRSALERAYLRHAGADPAALERAPMVALWASRLMRAEHRRTGVQARRRIVTTGSSRMLLGRSVHIVRSGGYGKRAARIYPVRTARAMAPADRARMVALAGAEWRAACES